MHVVINKSYIYYLQELRFAHPPSLIYGALPQTPPLRAAIAQACPACPPLTPDVVLLIKREWLGHRIYTYNFENVNDIISLHKALINQRYLL